MTEIEPIETGNAEATPPNFVGAWPDSNSTTNADNIGIAPLYDSVRLAVIRQETTYLTNMDNIFPSSPEPSPRGV